MGKNSPKSPYFFLQAFKKAKGEKNDPEGQMLQAMLIAQEKNNNQKPVYDGFLIGPNWRFATLHGEEYCLSQKYDATRREEIAQIIFALRKLKELILGTVKE